MTGAQTAGKIINGRVIRGGQIESGRVVCWRGGQLVPSLLPEEPCEIIDAAGRYVSPGFIDLHTHGGGGYDFLDATTEAFLGAARLHAQHGTTTLIPTATSGMQQEMLAMLRVFEQARQQNTEGADLPGIHFEGPYFSPEQCGAQDPAFVRAPDPEEYNAILAASDRILRWSAAPELPGSDAFAQALRAHGVLPSIGHTNADYEQVERAFAAGFTHITHLYSCMSTVHRRQAYRYAGVVESAYLIDGMTVEIIADGVHLPAPLLKMVYRLIGPERTALVTDSMRGAGMPDGDSILGSLKNGMRVVIEDGVAKLPDRSAFAGSVATTDRLVKTMCTLAEVPLTDAVRMATETPARIQGLSDRGALEPGKRADVILMDDAFHVSRTIINGRTVYSEDCAQA